MSLAIIVLLPILAGIGFLYWSSLLDDSPENNLMKLMFQLLYLPLLWLSIHLAVIDTTILYGADSTLIAQLGLFAEILGYLMLLIGLFIIYRIMKGVYNIWLNKKQQKYEEKYG